MATGQTPRRTPQCHAEQSLARSKCDFHYLASKNISDLMNKKKPVLAVLKRSWKGKTMSSYLLTLLVFSLVSYGNKACDHAVCMHVYVHVHVRVKDTQKVTIRVFNNC